ncbi:hypothetical protein ACFPYI_09135 [Halomarina salina]|uniref:Uncharacterized protein n=1 Tax=Halomarina salina TaxID=1872699 RepID=A0ABD5RMA9_9EURY|nr:hypothetical protein [Halomarina salina]
MTPRRPTHAKVREKAARLNDALGERDGPPVDVPEGYVLCEAVVAGYEPHSTPTIDEKLARVQSGATDAANGEGVGCGTWRRRGQAVVNLGMVGPGGVETLRDAGARIFVTDETDDYTATTVLVPLRDRVDSDSNPGEE